MTAPGWPNVERLLVAEFTAWQGDLEAEQTFTSGGVTPPDLEDHLPFVRVRRAGGVTDDVTDFPFVTVEVYSPTDAVSTDIAELIRRRLVGDFIRNAHGLMDSAECVTPHQELPAANEALRRIVTSYRLACRRLPVSV